MKRIAFAAKYAAFCIAATAANLGVQAAVFAVLDWELELYAGMAAGTGAGLALKYILDKRFVFAFKARDAGDDLLRFLRYSSMGLATTAIFWLAEWTADAILPGAWGRYVGAVAGLALGYYAKYRLDKRFVFVAGGR